MLNGSSIPFLIRNKNVRAYFPDVFVRLNVLIGDLILLILLRFMDDDVPPNDAAYNGAAIAQTTKDSLASLFFQCSFLFEFCASLLIFSLPLL
jgi:hypothetical protein